VLTKIKTWFLGLKTWQKVVVGFMAFSVLVAPFSGGAETSAPTSDSGTAPQVAEMPAPQVSEMPAPQVTEMPAPQVTEMPADNPAPSFSLTVAQSNAVEKALSYLAVSIVFSTSDLAEQLEYDGFSSADSELAVDYIKQRDWFSRRTTEELAAWAATQESIDRAWLASEISARGEEPFIQTLVCTTRDIYNDDLGTVVEQRESCVEQYNWQWSPCWPPEAMSWFPSDFPPPARWLGVTVGCNGGW
jgi:hypothetical protein